MLARKITTDPKNRLNPRMSKRSLARNAKQQCRVFHRECRRCGSELAKSGAWNLRTIPPLPFESVRVQRESPSKTSTSSEPRLDAQAAIAIRDNRRAQARSDRCRMRIDERLRTTPQGAERLDRRDEVINEALAEEVRREEQKRRSSDRTAAEVTEAESTASGSRESTIEPDPNPKRSLIVKSASTTVCGSRQERERRGIPDDDSRRQIEDKPEVDNEERAEPPGSPSTSIRRKFAVRSEPRSGHHTRSS